MEITEFAVERTTAATDILLGVITLAVALAIYILGTKTDRTKGLIWCAAFCLMSIASFFGASAHGFIMSFETNRLLWQPVNASLGLAVALFVIGVIYDLRGFWISKDLALSILLLGVAFYFFTLIFENLFVVFIVYEAVALLFSLAVYIILTINARSKVLYSWSLESLFPLSPQQSKQMIKLSSLYLLNLITTGFSICFRWSVLVFFFLGYAEI